MDGENSLRKVYLKFSIPDVKMIGSVLKKTGKKAPGNDVLTEVASGGNEPAVSRPTIIDPCHVIFLVRYKDYEMVKITDDHSTTTACVHGFILQKHTTSINNPKRGNESAKARSNMVNFTSYIKQKVVIELNNNCYWLDLLHPGRFYCIVDNSHENKESSMANALKAQTPVIRMNLDMKISEIDINKIGAEDDNSWLCSWYKLAKEQIKVDNVRTVLLSLETENPSNKTSR